MADSQISISQEFPKGFCQCGCGGKTKIPRHTVRRLGWIKDQPVKWINGHNKANWKGGRYVGLHGYIFVHQATHPNNRKGYVLEHILIIEKAMGKYLPQKAQGHHVNKNPSDNINSNLVACEDDAYHKLLHRRERAIKECGHANWRKCNYCKQWDAPENLVIREHPQSGVHHLDCSRQYAKNNYKYIKKH